MVKFTNSHNLVKRPLGKWRSIHGYGAAQIVNGRLLLCGYDVSLHLWRDAKYDGILESNGIPFRIEIKSTGLNKDPEINPNQDITFTSGGRSGAQISRSSPSREAVIKKDDVDFAFGINSHDGSLWVVPVEILAILKKKKIKCGFADIYKEKVSVFRGIPKTSFTTDMIRKGFLDYSIKELEILCKENKIIISNIKKNNNFEYIWPQSKKIKTVTVDYKKSLMLDIWKYILENC